jgi:hypothetical protein
MPKCAHSRAGTLVQSLRHSAISTYAALDPPGTALDLHGNLMVAINRVEMGRLMLSVEHGNHNAQKPGSGIAEYDRKGATASMAYFADGFLQRRPDSQLTSRGHHSMDRLCKITVMVRSLLRSYRWRTSGSPLDNKRCDRIIYCPHSLPDQEFDSETETRSGGSIHPLFDIPRRESAPHRSAIRVNSGKKDIVENRGWRR